MPTVLLFALALLACSKPDLASPADEPVATEESGGLASQMLAEVNALRETGCRCGTRWMPPAPALSWNTQLANAARRHAGDMQRNDFFNHRGSDGSDMAQRIEEAGYQWQTIAENIAWGHPDVASVVQAWKESPGHCENMMNSQYSEMGAARAGAYWVQDLGRR